jgi:hypothetical protein
MHCTLAARGLHPKAERNTDGYSPAVNFYELIWIQFTIKHKNKMAITKRFIGEFKMNSITLGYIYWLSRFGYLLNDRA